jgi:hypothetical protein
VSDGGGGGGGGRRRRRRRRINSRRPAAKACWENLEIRAVHLRAWHNTNCTTYGNLNLL